MKPPILFLLLALALIGLVVVSGMTRETTPAVPPTAEPTAEPTATYPPGREPMVLPANYRETFAFYAEVDRSDGITRKIYITPAALDAVRTGDSFPERTQIVIEAYAAARDADGKLLRDANGYLVPGDMQHQVHMGELRSTWLIEDLAASTHVGGWNFAALDDTTGAATGENLSDCFSCHDTASRRDFVFTRADLARYVQTGSVQYSYCPRPGRQVCG